MAHIRQVKLFVGPVEAIEKQINDWLRETKVKPGKVEVSFGPDQNRFQGNGHATLWHACVTYKEKVPADLILKPVSRAA
jgi:hypothetical protein